MHVRIYMHKHIGTHVYTLTYSHTNKPLFVYRYCRYKELKKSICNAEGSLENFALSYKNFGVHRSTDPKKPGIVAREWGETMASCVGCFNLFMPRTFAIYMCYVFHVSRVFMQRWLCELCGQFVLCCTCALDVCASVHIYICMYTHTHTMMSIAKVWYICVCVVCLINC